MCSRINSIDWSDFDKRRKWAIRAFWGLPVGMGLVVIGVGTGYYIMIVPGVVLIFAFMGLINHLQEYKCPNCGQFFSNQDNPVVNRWGSVKVVLNKKCINCGTEQWSA